MRWLACWRALASKCALLFIDPLRYLVQGRAPSDHRTHRSPRCADAIRKWHTPPRAAAVASLNWPSGNHLSFEPPTKHPSSLGKRSIYPLNLPARLPEDPFQSLLFSPGTLSLIGGASLSKRS